MREGPGDDDFNELSFLRRDPISGLETSVITLGLESPSQRIYPTGDGLITLIYPKEAVLSAMSPSTPVIRDDDGKIISPRRIRGNEERTREAIQKAYATECCRLSWNPERSRYYLYHPGIGVCGDAYLVDIEGEVGFDNVGAKGTIKVCHPAESFARNLSNPVFFPHSYSMSTQTRPLPNWILVAVPSSSTPALLPRSPRPI